MLLTVAVLIVLVQIMQTLGTGLPIGYPKVDSRMFYVHEKSIYRNLNS